MEQRIPSELTFSLGAAGASEAAPAVAHSPQTSQSHGWESWSFNFPSFLAGLTARAREEHEKAICILQLAANASPKGPSRVEFWGRRIF